MNQFKYLMLLSLALVLASCEGTDDDLLSDLEAPVFVEVLRPATEGAANVVEIRGEYMEVRSESSDHMHLDGTVTDNVGLSELKIDVHGVFDGHSHGRLNLLPALEIDVVVDLAGATSYTFEEDNLPREAYYYDDQNYRAGVYDVIFHAVDLAGNTTSFADGSSVLRHIYLRRPYQAKIDIVGDPEEAVDELDFTPGETLAIDGFITQRRGNGDLAFDVTFIKISIGEEHEDDHDHRKLDEGDEWEMYWGTSLYQTTSTGANLSGESIPAFDANNTLLLNELLEQNPLTLTEDFNHKILRIEVEDAGGNLTIREFELEVHN